MSSAPSVFYPQVTRLPDQTTETLRSRNDQQIRDPEFSKLLEQKIQETSLESVRSPLKFSAHALQRIQERKIPMNQELMAKISSAVEKAEQKGIQDGLILTDGAAWIVNVKNKTVVTAMDRGSLGGNVFSNIDGAIIV